MLVERHYEKDFLYCRCTDNKAYFLPAIHTFDYFIINKNEVEVNEKFIDYLYKKTHNETFMNNI